MNANSPIQVKRDFFVEKFLRELNIVHNNILQTIYANIYIFQVTFSCKSTYFSIFKDRLVFLL